MKKPIGVLCAALVACCAALAHAEVPTPDGNKQLAAEWADKAYERFEAGDYPAAIAAMKEAQKHARPPTFIQFLAGAYEKVGKVVEAEQLYREVVELKLPATAPKPWLTAQAESNKLLPLIAARIPKLTVSIVGPKVESVQAQLDGAKVDNIALQKPFALNPGVHKWVISAPGYVGVTREVTLKEKARETLVIELVPVPQETVTAPVRPVVGAKATAGPSVVGPTAGQRPPSSPGFAGGESPSFVLSPAFTVGKYVVAGLGIAGLIAGGVTGGIAFGEMDELKNGPCSPDLSKCAESARAGVNQVALLADVSTASFVIGGTFAALGIVMFVVPLQMKRPAAVGVALSPYGAFILGDF